MMTVIKIRMMDAWQIVQFLWVGIVKANHLNVNPYAEMACYLDIRETEVTVMTLMMSQMMAVLNVKLNLFMNVQVNLQYVKKYKIAEMRSMNQNQVNNVTMV